MRELGCTAKQNSLSMFVEVGSQKVSKLSEVRQSCDGDTCVSILEQGSR